MHDRPYRSSIIGYNAMKSLLGDNGSHFDPSILRTFLGNMGIFPVGSIVQLSDGSVGKVVSANGDAPLRPKIEVLIDARGLRVPEPRALDLVQKSDLFIAKAVDPREYFGER